ncbi:hypothetical protein ACFJIU_21950 [Mesorhizobium sp. UC74_2]|uniref:hypothetical protein n=1 Tax=Mesorhizobium sp. UC74_2 TaxID=3350171 RepID=UPI00366BEEA8
MASGAFTWADVVAHPSMAVKSATQSLLVAALGAFGPLSNPSLTMPLPNMLRGQRKAILSLCPCLYNQVDERPSPRAIVHFCEITLAERINSANVHDAFKVQHPGLLPPFAFPPAQQPGKNGGAIMELLCSEVLTNENIPDMQRDGEDWPIWNMPGHVLLNEGKMQSLKAFGDILIPCGPTNLVISVKSEAARERLLYSSNAIEGIGFGFFKQPEEFWTASRMNLYKRMGFSAIYIPDETHSAVMAGIVKRKAEEHAVNINGTPLYRPLSIFGADMRRVVGKSSLLL